MGNTSKQIEVEDFGASLAVEIKKIAAAVRNTQLTDTALVALIREQNQRLTKNDIREVLYIVRRLDTTYVKGEK
jgi:hypothetical protein